MTRSTPARPASRLGAVLVGASLLTGLVALSACSSGQITQTDTQVAAVPGVNVNSADGQIAVRNAMIVYASKYPAGATMPLELRVFNNSGKEAKLTGASISDSAGGQVVLVGGAASSASASPSPSTSASSSASSSASASPSGSKKASGSPSASASASASPSASPSPTSVGSSKIDLALPSNAPQIFSPSTVGGYLAIVGRSKELRAGETTNLTLTFTYGDGSQTAVTFDLPVSVPLSPPARVSPTVRVGE